MSRPLRIEYDGAWYHVMNRGAGYKDIFTDNSNRQEFLDLVTDIYQLYNVQTHAYCLMDNYYHLLLHTPNSFLSKSMQHPDGL